ncbi:MAG: DUF1015 domain-containing protein, partial [Bacteroidota bacterium]
MAILKPFKGIRPLANAVSKIACRPYDVLNEKEARQECAGNNDSFYHVIKPEIDFPDDFDHYAPEIYKKGKSNFDRMVQDGLFKEDGKDCYYIYRQVMNGRSQDGIVGCAHIDDYFNNVIKKHELTRPDKEEDRKNHIRYSHLNYEPVFFAYPKVSRLDEIVAGVTSGSPVYDFTADDGIRHVLWVVDNDQAIAAITEEFSKMPSTYVADGHHRTAAAALVGRELRDANPNHRGDEEYNYFLAVHFPDDQLAIMDYNRVVKDLNGMTDEQFIEALSKSFDVVDKGKDAYRPDSLHNFSMYLSGKWYSLTAKQGTFNDSDPIGVLDVTILSEQ